MLLARAAAAMSLSVAYRSLSASTARLPPRQAMNQLGASWKTPQPSPLSILTRRRIGSVAAAASANNGLEPPDVRKLAKMAQLEVTDEEVADWEPKIRKIVSWFDQLQAVDLEAEEEKERQAEQGKREENPQATFSLRVDEISQFGGDPAEALREAPEKEGEFLKVPRIM